MEEETVDLDGYMLELVDLMSEDRQGVRCDKFWKTETTERGILGKRDDQRSKKRRLYMKKVDQ
jgi:hypothetical protein